MDNLITKSIHWLIIDIMVKMMFPVNEIDSDFVCFVVELSTVWSADAEQ